MDAAIEGFGVGKGLVGQMMRLEIVPDNLDVVELGRVFRQPLDEEPVLARLERFASKLADVDRPVVLDQGRMALQAPPLELFASTSFRSAYLGIMDMTKEV